MKIDRRWWWIALGLLSIAIKYALNGKAQFIEQQYSRKLFQTIRFLFDHSLGLLPFPSIYLLVALLVAYLIYTIINRKSRPFFQQFKEFSWSLLAVVAAIVFFFMALWGYNYGQIPIDKRMNLTKTAPTEAELEIEILAQSNLLAIQRLQISPDTSESIAAKLPKNLEEIVRKEVRAVLAKIAYPNNGKVRVREIHPKGILLRFSTAGIYLPFVGEGHIDAGLHSLQKPFTLAHEMLHGYGFTDEGECNFLAYLACRQSDDSFVRYSGELSYWRYLASALRKTNPTRYKQFRNELSPKVRADLEEINQTMLHYPDILPNLRDKAYDSYLKAQGVRAGLKSYDEIILLVRAWKQNKND